MNLIALPSTNEFVRLVKPEKLIDVSSEVDELIQATPSEMRPVVLVLLSGKTQEQAAKDLGITRSDVQRVLAIIKLNRSGQKAANEAQRECNEKRLLEMYHKAETARQLFEMASAEGLKTLRGFDVNLRYLYWWMAHKGLTPPVPVDSAFEAMKEMREKGMGFVEISQELNRRDIKTKTGKSWNRKLACDYYKRTKARQST